MKTVNQFIFNFVLVLLFFNSNSAYSNGIGIINGATGEYLTITQSDIEVSVYNQIATIRSTQVLKNLTGAPANFKYAFPLNEGSNPISLKWYINGQWHEAIVSSNSQDESIPGGGSGGSIDPNLTNYLGEFPLYFPLGDILENDSTIIFELTYVELLPYYMSNVSFSYKNDISPLQSENLISQSFEFNLSSGREILGVELYDLSSADSIQDFEATIQYSLLDSEADFDYYLEYELLNDDLGVIPLSTMIPDSMMYCDDYGQGYVSMIVEPKSDVNSEVIDKNFTLIIDMSGSMAGPKMVQAKNAASFIVENLNYGDNFNVISFSTNVNSLFSGHEEYNLSNESAALNYISAIADGGSTNISGALSIAINEFDMVDSTKANIILFFTDGMASSGITDTPGILQMVDDEIAVSQTSIFLYPVGIGDQLDQGLLTALAQNNNGEVTFIGADDIEDELSSLFLSINNPVLINTEISFDPPIITELCPYPYPNLYLGEQLIVSGRYSEPQTVTMHIQGQAFNVPVEYDFEFELSDSSDVSMSVLPKIWAKQKMDALTLDYYLASTSFEGNEIQSEIDSISTCYGVISLEFTSFEDTGSVEIEELDSSEKLNAIQITPNPFEDHFQIEINSLNPEAKTAVIDIFDINGKLIFSLNENVVGRSSAIEISGLKDFMPGIYICRIQIDDEIHTIRLIKK